MEGMKRQAPDMRPLEFLGHSREDLRAMPKPVRVAFGFALNEAQRGDTADAARPLHGFGGAGVLEIVEDYAGDAYRAVYAVRFADKVHVLHVFQKKSRRGSKTPPEDMALIRARLREAEERYRRRRA